MRWLDCVNDRWRVQTCSGRLLGNIPTYRIAEQPHWGWARMHLWTGQFHRYNANCKAPMGFIRAARSPTLARAIVQYGGTVY